jgi:hypothetical protein
MVLADMIHMAYNLGWAMPKIRVLGEFEQLVLTAIARLGNDACKGSIEVRIVEWGQAYRFCVLGAEMVGRKRLRCIVAR